MKAILLDTSIFIDYLRQKNKEKSPLFKLTDNNFYISLITHTELFSGKSVWEKKARQEEIETILYKITILPFSIETSKLAGKLRATYNTDLIDSIIAATAIINNLELVTLNAKDFKPIPDLKIYYEAND